jgi:hypothetical protein
MWMPLLLLAAAPANTSAVLVLDPVGEALSLDQRHLLAARLGAALDRQLPQRFEVVTAADVRELLSVEAQRQELGCDDAGCAAEIADALGSTHVVVSHVGKLGEAYALSVELLDVKSARVLARADLVESRWMRVPERAGELVAPLADALAPGHSWKRALWPAGFVTGALLITAGGIAWDTLSPTSRNRELDAVDALGIAAYVSAAGLVGVAFLNPLEAE